MNDLTVTGLHKAFGAVSVLVGLDLEVPAGSLTAILGPSGSGKTTLLRLMAGFERADAGTIGIGGVLVDGPGVHLPPERRRIGYVPQEGSLFPHLTVAGNVGFGLPARQHAARQHGARQHGTRQHGTRLRRARQSRARQSRDGQVATLLETVGLGGLGRRYPHQLSGGQQQRVALARALAIEPAVVLLDEPFASLDAHLRANVRADVQEIFRRAGTTAVLVTHDQDEALSIADRVAVLRGGMIAQYAPPEAIYRRPADPGLARFVGEANLLSGVVRGHEVETPLGTLPLDPAAAELGTAGQVTVLIRPEQLEMIPNGPGISARVITYRYHGHDAVLDVQPRPETGAPPIVVRVAGGSAHPAGSAVCLRVRGPVFAWPAN
jgi:iron(III) transport system ATP-binding protein